MGKVPLVCLGLPRCGRRLLAPKVDQTQFTLVKDGATRLGLVQTGGRA